jgi:hypothetical protein
MIPAWPLFAGLGPLGALPTVPRLARVLSGLVLPGWGLAGLADDCELVNRELTSNVIRAATHSACRSRAAPRRSQDCCRPTPLRSGQAGNLASGSEDRED